MSVETTLRDEAIRLAELDRAVIRAFMESDLNGLAEAIVDYSELKKTIRNRLMELPAVRVKNKKAQEVLRKISEGIELPSDDLIRRIEARIGAEESLDELTDAEIQD